MLGGDYKFLLVAVGIPGIIAKFFCVYCKCSNSDKCNLNKNWSMTSVEHGARLEYLYDQQVKQTTKGKSKKNKHVEYYSITHEPLFKVRPHEVVIDQLHMFMRISDKLFNLLVMELRTLDNIYSINCEFWCA